MVFKMVPLFALMYPSCLDISTLVFIEYPSRDTCLPYFSERVIICCIRLISEEKVAVMILPLACLKISSRFSKICFSDIE